MDVIIHARFYFLSPCPPRLYTLASQSQPICLSVYNTTLLGFVNLAIQLLMVDQVAIKVGTRTFTAVGGTVFIVSVIFAPKAYCVSKNAASLTPPGPPHPPPLSLLLIFLVTRCILGILRDLLPGIRP